MKLAGKIALVTGGTKGIGKGIAQRLARDGASVAITYHGDETAAAQALDELKSLGAVAIAIKADTSQVSEIKNLFQQLDEQLGRLDILVNNAGMGILMPLEEVDEASYDRVFATNVKGVFFTTQEAVKRLPHGGKIVNISSSTTYFPMPGTSVYAGSKVVLRMFTEVLAKELGPRGIHVNSVVPGPTAPGMFVHAPKHLQAEAAAQSPFGRIGTPQDIASVVSFLVSEDAAWVTGQHILTNGGATI